MGQPSLSLGQPLDDLTVRSLAGEPHPVGHFPALPGTSRLLLGPG